MSILAVARSCLQLRIMAKSVNLSGRLAYHYLWLASAVRVTIPGMGKSKPSKKPVNATANKSPVLYVRLTDEHEAALAAYIARQKAKPDRQAVGLAALEEFLRAEGLWPWPPKS